MSENDVDKIGTADFSHNENSVFLNQVAPIKADKPSVWVWVSLAGLLLLALLVIFVLPSIVSEYKLPLEKRVELVEASAVDANTEAVSTISPFEEAQRSLQRKEAQDVLAELLATQAELDALEVERWAQEDYETALEQASIGDEYYRTQDFVLARTSYEASRDGLLSLLGSIPAVLVQTLSMAEQALVAQNSVAAFDQFSLALLFEPENEAAQIGVQRAQTLNDVVALLKSAEKFQESGELQQALIGYNEALDLDSRNEIAAEKVDEVLRLITEKEFAELMSNGYALLQNENPEQAVNSFRQALQLGIKQEQAQAAIIQTENEIANAEINRLSKLIVGAEQSEQWQEAVNFYDDVLALDNNLLFAINGKDYADKRTRLDNLLEQSISNPERFSDNAVFEETLDVYYTGRSIEPPGPRLVTQLDELERLLENSQTFIDILFRSDNLTDVTLLRVENLGAFEQVSLSLKPGRYVAVGKRSGYREVREEFTVGFGLTPDMVVVQCNEPIVSANRR
jgi:tetratricopeptide (TPR) repeat protein